MTFQNDLILRAARGEKTERTPVWLMRQAGRILPEYRAVRGKLSGFKELVETPERASEVTIQPVEILGVDAAIIFSDILVIPEAMGLEYQMIAGKGPYFEHTVKTMADVDKLRVADPSEYLKYVTDAISITKKELNNRVPLIGFAGAPWTIFSYMIEGQGSKTFSNAKKMLYTDPKLSHTLLQKITDTTKLYLKAQIEAGADLLQLFDSWAGILSKEQYMEFAYPYIKQICDEINQEVPVTVFAKGAYFVRKELGQLNCNTLGVDWNMDISETRNLVGNKVLQGNLDPCLLYASDEELVTGTKNMLNAFGPEKHIANLGHGVYPDTNPEKVKLFIETVKNHKF
jgi:uroporphyrinogen decarboxylase